MRDSIADFQPFIVVDTASVDTSVVAFSSNPIDTLIPDLSTLRIGMVGLPRSLPFSSNEVIVGLMLLSVFGLYFLASIGIAWAVQLRENLFCFGKKRLFSNGVATSFYRGMSVGIYHITTTLSIAILLLFVVYRDLSIEAGGFWRQLIHLGVLFVLIELLNLIKYLTCISVEYLFFEPNQLRAYRHLYDLSYGLMSYILIPITLLVMYAPGIESMAFPLLIVMIGAFKLYDWIALTLNLRRDFLSFLDIILYLCTADFLPVAFIFVMYQKQLLLQ